MGTLLFVIGMISGATEEATEINAAPVEEAPPDQVVVPAPSEPAAEGAQKEVPKGLAAQLAASEAGGRFYHLRGDVLFRMLAVSDQDPRNDIWMTYRLRGDIDVCPHARALLWGGIQQKFWAEPDESGWLLEDTQFGLTYNHEVSLDFVPLDFFKERKLDFIHIARLYLPTSRASINQDLYFAPEWFTRITYVATKDLSVISDLYFQYRFNRYAEQAGLEGLQNIQFTFGPSLGVEYTVFDHPSLGAVTAGADALVDWIRKYPSRESYRSQASSQRFFNQEYGWDAYVTYSPPEYLTVVLILQQNGPVLRDGLINLHAVKREETEFLIWAIARY